MSTEYFQVDDKSLQEARAKAQSGNAQVLVLENNAARFFLADYVLGYLSWTAIQGVGRERIHIDYGHDVPNGIHTFDATLSRRVTYTAPDGTLYYAPTTGEIFLNVERPPTGTSFKHTGVLLNVRFENAGHVVVINGTYVNSSD